MSPLTWTYIGVICLLAQIHIATFNEEMSLLDHQIYVCLVFRVDLNAQLLSGFEGSV